MTHDGMKCTRCRGPAQYRTPAHNARFCGPCLEIFIGRQVEKAIRRFHMLLPGQKVVVAVSGGKDSAVLWHLLHGLGYETHGLHLSLDLPGFSEVSAQAARETAQRLGRPLEVLSFRELAGVGMQEIVWATKRSFCSVCGTMKRHYINVATQRLGATVVASGHHLDDETGRLLGNLIRGHQTHLDKQWPVLEGSQDGLVKKIKPLCRLQGSELASLAHALDLPHHQGQCPMSKGATLHNYQRAMDLLEEAMPGTKNNFYFGFLERKGGPPELVRPGGRCDLCGEPSFQPTCTVCQMLETTRKREAEKAARDQEAE